MPLIAAALAAIVVAGVIYLHPALPAAPAKQAPKVTKPLLLSNQYSATYDFVTPALGWALVLGRGGDPVRFSVYRTSDAAKHWSKQLTGDSPTAGLSSIQFFDHEHGLITVGSPGLLYRTVDSGLHWQLMQLPLPSTASITFSDRMHGWLIGWSDTTSPYARHFFATVDGGTTWGELPLPSWAVGGGKGGAGGELQFRRPADGWLAAGADLPTVYSTIDGGVSWQPHTLPGLPPPGLQSGGKPLPVTQGYAFITSVSLLPETGVLATFDYWTGQGVAYTSFDGGSTWRALAALPAETAYSDLVFEDSFHWWAMRFGTLWKTSNAGQSWQFVSQQTDDWDYRPQVIDATHAWALLIGSAGNQVPGTGLALTVDGGLHWKQVDAPQQG